MDTRAISTRVRQFKNMDPDLYDALMKLLELWVAEITVAVTEAPPDQILIFQGRAQQARKMFQMFTELPTDTSLAVNAPAR